MECFYYIQSFFYISLLYTMHVAFLIYLLHYFFVLLLVIPFLFLFNSWRFACLQWAWVVFYYYFRLVLLFFGGYWHWWQELWHFYGIRNVDFEMLYCSWKKETDWIISFAVNFPTMQRSLPKKKTCYCLAVWFCMSNFLKLERFTSFA